MKKLSLALFATLLVSCSINSNNNGDFEPSSSSKAQNYLTIKNESSVRLDSVVWNGINFGSIPIGHFSKKETPSGTGRINFQIPNEKAARVLNARTNSVIAVESESIEFAFSDNTLVEEIASPSNNGRLIDLKKQNVKEFDITFHLNGGTLIGREDPFSLKADSGGRLSEVYSEAGTPTKGAIPFAGWHTQDSTELLDTIVVRGNMDVHALWDTYSSIIDGSWKDEASEEEDKIFFNSSTKTGWNEWIDLSDNEGDIFGFDFTWTATAVKIEITITKIYVRYSKGGKYESNDPSDIGLDSKYSLPYVFSEDNNILYMWNREYARQ
jgi:hypothetical protein